MRLQLKSEIIILLYKLEHTITFESFKVLSLLHDPYNITIFSKIEVGFVGSNPHFYHI